MKKFLILIGILFFLVAQTQATETTWRHSGFEIWGFDLNFSNNYSLNNVKWINGTNLNVSNVRQDLNFNNKNISQVELVNGVNFSDSLVSESDYIIYQKPGSAYNCGTLVTKCIFAKNQTSGNLSYGTDFMVVTQSAIDEINRTGDLYGKTVFVRAGTYNISTGGGLTVPFGVSIKSNGALLDATLFSGTLIRYSNTTASIQNRPFDISGFYIKGNASNNTIGIHLSRVSVLGEIHNIRFQNIKYPIKVEGEVWDIPIYNIVATGYDIGINMSKGNSTGAGTNFGGIHHNDIEGGNISIMLDSGTATRIHDNYFERCDKACIFIPGTGNAAYVDIHDNFFNVDNYVLVQNTTGISIGEEIVSVHDNDFTVAKNHSAIIFNGTSTADMDRIRIQNNIIEVSQGNGIVQEGDTHGRHTVDVSGNTINSDSNNGLEAIRFGSVDSIIADNTIDGFDVGIWLNVSNSTSNKITGNKIYRTDKPLVNCSGNLCTGNLGMESQSPYEGKVNKTNLVLHYRTDENQSGVYNSSKVYDDSVYSNSGVYIGNGTANWSTGLHSTSLLFDGVNDYVNAGTSASLNFSLNRSLGTGGTTLDGSFSVFAWTKLDDKTNQYVVSGKDQGVSRWNLYVGSSKLYSVFLKDIEGTSITATNAADNLIISQWVHFGFVRDRSNQRLKMYINGYESANISDTTLNLTSQGVTVGAYNTGGSNFVQGSISDVRIYSRVLSGEEVSNLYYSNPVNEQNTNIQSNNFSVYNSTGNILFNPNIAYIVPLCSKSVVNQTGSTCFNITSQTLNTHNGTRWLWSGNGTEII